MRRLTFNEALAELRERLKQVPRNERQAALDDAAATYVTMTYGWYAAALELLVAVRIGVATDSLFDRRH